MCKQGVPGSFFSAHAQEPENEASLGLELASKKANFSKYSSSFNLKDLDRCMLSWILLLFLTEPGF